MISGFELRDPWFLLAALAGPILFLIASRSGSSLQYSSMALLANTPTSWRVRLRFIPPFLILLASCALAIALAGPRIGDATTKVHREGVAMALVVDVSGSMKLIDIDENKTRDRLEVSKEALRTCIEARPDDHLGMVTFASFADAICPLTLDHANLLQMVDQLEISELESECNLTAIGDGLALACKRLDDQKAKSKVVILMTDGANNGGVIDPLDAAKLAAELGIKVHTIGVGGTGQVFLKVKDRFGRERIKPANRFGYSESRFDEKTLKQISAQTSGQYFHAGDEDGLQAVYQQIDDMERTKITELRYLQYEELYGIFVNAALALLAASALLSRTIFRRLP